MSVVWLWWLTTLAYGQTKIRMEMTSVKSGIEFQAIDDRRKTYTVILYGVRLPGGSANDRAKSSLQVKLKNKVLIIEPIPQTTTSKVWVAGREDAALYQLSWGQVKLDTVQLLKTDTEAYTGAEKLGQIRRMGIWEDVKVKKVPSPKKTNRK